MCASHSASEPTAAQVRAQRDRMLASEVFSRSRRQSAFLAYVIDAQLEGRSDKLKEFTLGIDVFGRDESFDPSVESIVRVEAGRLRAKLREYYGGEGQGEAVRIDIPKGHYVPAFSLAHTPDVERGRSYQWPLWVGLAAAALIIAVVYSVSRQPSRSPAPVVDIPPLPAPTSIAVLPLRDFSGTPEDYFSDAMTDALISSLAGIRGLRVTSLTSVMTYKNTEAAIPEIGRALGVAYLVEGSVFRDGDDVRITAQLLDAKTDKHVWSETFDRTTPNLASLQSEVSAAVAAQISDKMLPSAQPGHSGWNPAAYEAYMKGRYFYNQFTAEGFHQGMKYFQEAIDIEPRYAAAYAGLASCHCLLAGHGLELVSPVVSLPQARSLANKAIGLNSDLAEPIAFLGIIKFKYEWDSESAEAMLSRATELNPSLFQAYVWHSQILEALGRHDDAISRARHAKRLNPLSLAAGLNLGWQLFQAGMYIEADAEIDKLLEFNPGFWGGHWAKGHIYQQHGSYASAIKAFQRAVELGGGHSLPMSALGHAYAIAGMPSEARRVVADLEALSKEVYVSPFHLASIYAGLNDPDLMFEWLERAYAVRARSLAWLNVSPEMKMFHDDVRFQSLLDRIGIVADSAAN